MKNKTYGHTMFSRVIIVSETIRFNELQLLRLWSKGLTIKMFCSNITSLYDLMLYHVYLMGYLLICLTPHLDLAPQNAEDWLWNDTTMTRNNV